MQSRKSSRKTTDLDSVRLSVVRALLGAVLFIVPVMVLIGWWSEAAQVVQLHPDWAPMQFNTALAFLVMSAGVVTRKARWLTTLLPLGLGAATLFQYATGWSLGIDTLFTGDPFIEVQASHPGRMSPATAGCFSLMSIGNYLFHERKQFGWAGGTAALVLVVAACSLFGYITGVTTYAIPGATDMAAHTSVLFCVLGAAGIAGVVEVSPDRRRWASATVTLVLATAVVMTASLSLGDSHAPIMVLGLVVAAFAGASVHYAEAARARSAELQQANADLKRLTRRDPLTGLLNRRGLDRALLECRARMERESVCGWAILLDLDDFKNVNTAFGHAGGDTAMRETARIMRSTMRVTDWLGRQSGDEFLVMFLARDAGEAALVAERLVIAMRSNVLRQDGAEITVTASAAVVEIGEIRKLDHVIRAGQRALADAKRQGKDRVRLDRESYPGADVEKLLLDRSQYRAVRQPIVSLRTRRAVGGEYLIRHDGFANPDALFRAAEGCALVSEVDERCLDVCVAAASSGAGEHRSVNIFPSSLRAMSDEEFEDLRGLTLEVSERQLVGRHSTYAESCELARAHGVRIALDDLGSGYASLNAVVALRPDIVKIDRSWVSGATESELATRRLRDLVTLAGGLGATLVAEGIETEAEAQLLESMGVELGQGWLFGRPS